MKDPLWIVSLLVLLAMVINAWPESTKIPRVWQPRPEMVPEPFEMTVPPLLSEATPPPFSVETVVAIERATASAYELARAKSPWDPTEMFLRFEAIGSSAIEGVETPLRTLYRLLVEKHPPSMAEDPNSNIVRCTLDALRESRGGRTDPTEIRALHAVVANGWLRRDAVGAFRTSMVWIGGRSPSCAAYVPPPADLLLDLMRDLGTLGQRADLSPLVLASLVHGQFESIHPFADGNGRVGRCLIHSCANLPVPVPFSRHLMGHRLSYYRALADFHDGNPDPLIRLIATAVDEQARRELAFLAALVAIRDRMEQQVGTTFRKDSVARKLLGYLCVFPITTAAEVARTFEVSPTGARLALRQLERCGIVSELDGRERYKTYVASLPFDCHDSRFSRHVP